MLKKTIMNQMNKKFYQKMIDDLSLKVDRFPEQTMNFSVIASFFLSFILLSLTALDLVDSDLWFHLNQGRELFATGTIPSTSFFSYIEPVRHWINYSWLFQAIVYQIFLHTGYVGLIVFRSLIYVFIGYLFYLIILKNRPYNFLAAILTVFCFIGVMPRSIVVRPHIFTYLNLLLLLFAFERKKFFWLFPIVFTLEANLHGIAYPLLLLIWGSYLMDYYVCYKRCKPIPVSKKDLAVILISPLFLLFSPYWYHLFALPFDNAVSFVSYYIVEMNPTSFLQLFVFRFWPLPYLVYTIKIIVILLAFLFLIYSFYKKTFKISYIVLFVGSIFLLSKSKRFIYDCIFFIVPILSMFLSNMKFVHKKKYIFVNIAIMFFVPLSVFTYYLYHSVHYPLSFMNVPQVGTKFIYQLPKDQTVLMSPAKAGYLAWTLFPKHKIFMDLELALFDDVDAFEAMYVFHNPVVLQHHINKYHASVLYVPLNKQMLSDYSVVFKKYKPVFFDDFGIIYVRRDVSTSFPELAFLDTIAAQEVNKDAFTEKNKNRLIEELKRVADFDVSGFKANVLLGNAYYAFEQPQNMLEVADRLINGFPDQAAGFILKAQALFMLHQLEESVRYYKQAVTKQGAHDRRLLGKNYYIALATMKRFDEAYEVLNNAYNPFMKETPPDILYEFAVGAVNAREYEAAVTFIQMALLSLPDFDLKRRNELLRLQRELNAFFSKKNT